MVKKTKNTYKTEITYKDSGVDIDEGNKLITLNLQRQHQIKVQLVR